MPCPPCRLVQVLVLALALLAACAGLPGPWAAGDLLLHGGGPALPGQLLVPLIDSLKPGQKLCAVLQEGAEDAGLWLEERLGERLDRVRIPAEGAQALAEDAGLARRFEACGAFYFGGGLPRLYDQAFQVGTGPGAVDGPALAVLRRKQAAGAMMAGLSAGAMVAGDPLLCTCGPESNLKALLREDLEITRGFGLVDGVMIDAHMLARGLIGRHVWALAKTGRRIGVGIDEGTLVRISGHGGYWEVAGDSAVLLVRLPEGASPRKLDGIRVSLLWAGDRFRPGDGKVIPGGGRKPVEPATAGDTVMHLRAPVFAPQVLRRAIVDFVLADSAQADGVAGPVRLVMRRGAAMQVYMAAGDGRATVIDLIIDLHGPWDSQYL